MGIVLTYVCRVEGAVLLEVSPPAELLRGLRLRWPWWDTARRAPALAALEKETGLQLRWIDDNVKASEGEFWEK